MSVKRQCVHHSLSIITENIHEKQKQGYDYNTSWMPTKCATTFPESMDAEIANFLDLADIGVLMLVSHRSHVWVIHYLGVHACMIRAEPSSSSSFESFCSGLVLLARYANCLRHVDIKTHHVPTTVEKVSLVTRYLLSIIARNSRTLRHVECNAEFADTSLWMALADCFQITHLDDSMRSPTLVSRPLVWKGVLESVLKNCSKLVHLRLYEQFSAQMDTHFSSTSHALVSLALTKCTLNRFNRLVCDNNNSSSSSSYANTTLQNLTLLLHDTLDPDIDVWKSRIAETLPLLLVLHTLEVKCTRTDDSGSFIVQQPLPPVVVWRSTSLTKATVVFFKQKYPPHLYAPSLLSFKGNVSTEGFGFLLHHSLKLSVLRAVSVLPTTDPGAVKTMRRELRSAIQNKGAGAALTKLEVMGMIWDSCTLKMVNTYWRHLTYADIGISGKLSSSSRTRLYYDFFRAHRDTLEWCEIGECTPDIPDAALTDIDEDNDDSDVDPLHYNNSSTTKNEKLHNDNGGSSSSSSSSSRDSIQSLDPIVLHYATHVEISWWCTPLLGAVCLPRVTSFHYYGEQDVDLSHLFTRAFPTCKQLKMRAKDASAVVAATSFSCLPIITHTSIQHVRLSLTTNFSLVAFFAWLPNLHTLEMMIDDPEDTFAPRAPRRELTLASLRVAAITQLQKLERFRLYMNREYDWQDIRILLHSIVATLPKNCVCTRIDSTGVPCILDA